MQCVLYLVHASGSASLTALYPVVFWPSQVMMSSILTPANPMGGLAASQVEEHVPSDVITSFLLALGVVQELPHAHQQQILVVLRQLQQLNAGYPGLANHDAVLLWSDHTGIIPIHILPCCCVPEDDAVKKADHLVWVLLPDAESKLKRAQVHRGVIVHVEHCLGSNVALAAPPVGDVVSPCDYDFHRPPQLMLPQKLRHATVHIAPPLFIIIPNDHDFIQGGGVDEAADGLHEVCWPLEGHYLHCELVLDDWSLPATSSRHAQTSMPKPAWSEALLSACSIPTHWVLPHQALCHNPILAQEDSRDQLQQEGEMEAALPVGHRSTCAPCWSPLSAFQDVHLQNMSSS
eukprot:CAMPEP_0202339482 /NCGR_PEP_ID=MMETSP1126-20121109/1325_1 /ASSEMBLY_ACC=CAM_ASM_000457 /TAXON_ID=3047 /ORGANISM="Dunaliella tertiolecta, Strain CCMP1320" /LENGTH=346 /DNA_ID=CAMNT_0048930039 /DNA_START=364 /DNA_END=1403 /DNA_ORIENTATION=-